jgi:hypothetical protein
VIPDTPIQQATRDQRADIDRVVVHLREVVALTARLRQRQGESTPALEEIDSDSDDFHAVHGVFAVAALMARVYTADGLRRVEVMLAQLDALR